MWQDEGYAAGNTDIAAAIEQLSLMLIEITHLYEHFSEDELLYKASPTKWSRQELLGHLTDSAINNLKRFTEAQFAPLPYITLPYEQDELVRVNHYQQLPAVHIIFLWRALNEQILYIIKNMPAEKLGNAVKTEYNNTGVKTLEWLICNYVEHMKHHMQQM